MNVKINSESNETQEQVVSFSDQNQQWTYSIDNRLDSAHTMLDSNDATLSNFFSRPIKIASINWTVGSVFGTTINPWQLYFENLRVINRITNYNVLRSKLCVRIMINGNGFHYGRALASYRPLHQDDNMIAWRYGLVPEDMIAASQRMHVWLDPTKSQGGTLCLPYVFYKNGMSIPEEDWQQMGELDIASITSLLHANGGTDSVTISVFAWAEDVSLSIPTIAEPGALSPQAGEYEEVGKGPISGPASTVEKAAALLSTVPRIAPFALATKMAAGAVGQIAKMFGMSRPVDAGPIGSYKPTYMGNMANSNVMDTSTKLTYDVKQELTIDPIATGLGPDDEMAITSIAKRESYLTQFAWSTSKVPEDLLWTCRVTPLALDRTIFATQTEYHLTPMAFAALPFEHWRGSINYRFQIVASAFHKGRLKIVYDPYSNATTEYNVQQTHVIDLAKERDFTVTINWGQEFSYLDHRAAMTAPFSTVATGAGVHGEDNGYVSVYVVNDLTTPSATLSDVSVLVSVSAGDDFEVVNPQDENIANNVYFIPQAGEFEFQAGELSSADEDLTTEETKPVDTVIEKSFASDTRVDVNQKIYFGDPVTSLRQVFKRYMFHRCYAPAFAKGSNESYITIQNSNFPIYRGFCGTGNNDHNASTPVDPTPYNYVTNTHLNYFTPAFLCRRGGLRAKYAFDRADGNYGLISVVRQATNGDTKEFPVSEATMATTSSTSQNERISRKRAFVGFAGSHATHASQQPVLEVEFPFATNYRFSPARSTQIRVQGNPFTQQHKVKFPADTTISGASACVYVSTGEDFSLSFFQAVPVFWSQSSQPGGSATDPS